MASSTTNYGLTKPDATELYDIAVQNANMDTIDGQMKTNADGVEALYYTAGDSFDMTNGCFAGTLNNDKKTIYFTIPLNKPLKDVGGVSLPGNFTCFHPEGLLFSSSVLSSLGTVNVYRANRGYGLGVRVVLTTAVSQTGNRPVTIYATSGNTLSFT